MAIKPIVLQVLCLVFLHTSLVIAQGDKLGLGHGYTNLHTKNFDIELVHDAQVIVSLKPSQKSFDFLPSDYLPFRAGNGQYHWGDITLRYRLEGSTTWIDVDSAASRQAITPISASGSLAASNLGPTIPVGSRSKLNITRHWTDVSGDLGLEFTITNAGGDALEIGSLGFPAEFNSIFTNRSAVQTQERCSLSDPYIGMHGGYIQAVPVSGVGPALVVTPLGDTPLEAYRNLVEPNFAATAYGSQVFEGFYEWQTLTKAWAENEWKGTTPWNTASSRTLQAGESLKVGLRFSVADSGIRGIDNAIKNTGTPFVRGIPGYIIPQDLPAQLLVQPPPNTTVTNITAEPADAFVVEAVSPRHYELTPSSTTSGRVRVTIQYSDGKRQTVHYLITKPAPEAVRNLGNFLTTEQWFADSSDPFGRAPSIMTYDYEDGQIVLQDDRVWIAGLSDEAGAGSFLAATIKQAIQPSAEEIVKLEEFVDGVLWGTIQTADYAVRKSAFFYEPALVPDYTYDKSLTWTGWPSWNKNNAYLADRAYDYVHVAAAYWGLYRAGRGYPQLLKSHTWDWYLNQSYNTVMRVTETDRNDNSLAGYADLGLMGETVFGELLTDLKREGWTANAIALEARMERRARLWDKQAVPFGSEMAWDSTGQEGVYYWAKYFGYGNTATKAANTVTGFMPTVPHWGWNGNARRYWDNIYGGKLRRIERQIHHYGSGLNSLVALSAFRSDPSDSHLLRIGYGGMNGPLSNINGDGFAAASFHSFPDTLAWDAYSGDYGPNFVGLALGAATYIVEDAELGFVAYGGAIVSSSDGVITVQPRDAARRAVFVAPLGVLVKVDAGEIQEVIYESGKKGLTVALAQTAGGPETLSAVLWIDTPSTDTNYTVTSSTFEQSRQGWQIPLDSDPTVVEIGPLA